MEKKKKKKNTEMKNRNRNLNLMFVCQGLNDPVKVTRNPLSNRCTFTHLARIYKEIDMCALKAKLVHDIETQGIAKLAEIRQLTLCVTVV